MTTLVTWTTWPGRILSASDPPGGNSPEAMSRRILARSSLWFIRAGQQERSHGTTNETDQRVGGRPDRVGCRFVVNPDSGEALSEDGRFLAGSRSVRRA